MPFDPRTNFDVNLHHMVQAIVTVLAVIACGVAFWVAYRWFMGAPVWPF